MKTTTIKNLIYAYGLGAATLAIMTLHFTPIPKEVSYEQKVEALAATLDNTIALHLVGGEVVNPHKVETIPVPKRKPEFGYSLSYIDDMNEFVKGFVE